MDRKRFRGWCGLFFILALFLTFGYAYGQDYPTKPIEVIVGYPPGGGTDMIARAVADAAPKYVGQPLVVINKAGATGTIAAQSVASAKPDGYLLLVAGGSETITVPHFRSLPYDAINDFVPIIRFMIERVGFYVKTDSSWKSMKELVEDARKNPEKYTYATSGIGGIHHSTVLVMEKRTGVHMRHVPHKGGAETLAALAGGHVNVAMASPNEAYALVQGGRIRPLAHSSLARSPVEPNTPTLRELGYDVFIENQKGFVFPKNTLKPIVQKLHDSLKKVFDDPQFQASAQKLQVELAYLSGEDFHKSMRAMYDQVGSSLKK